MQLRQIPPSFPAQVVSEIDARLDTICATHGVTVPLAIESGSRAWGFPSLDSDFDCRFLFVRPAEQHVSLRPQRDVIETPLINSFDVNGWDLGKALKLLLKGNAVIIEWLQSPILYRGESWFRDELLAFALGVAERGAIAKHYLHLGERQRRLHFGDGITVPQKKIFYALRPAAVLRWLRLHPEASIPPMHFPTVMKQCAPPAALSEQVAKLIERKAASREVGVGPLPDTVSAFLDEEFRLARETAATPPRTPPDVAYEAAERLYRDFVRRAFEPTI